MITIGAFKAKTHFSALLERVAGGEEVVITKHGKPIARLVSAGQFDRKRADQAFAKLKEMRGGPRSVVFRGRSCAMKGGHDRDCSRFICRA